MRRVLILAVLLALVGAWCAPPRARIQPDGVLAPDTPTQEALHDAAPFPLDGYLVQPLARFSATARVLSRETYRFDAEAALSPMDLALGWGRMSDSRVLAGLEIGQGGRWFSYRWGRQGPPIPPDEIRVSAANMHMIPADAGVAASLGRVRAGDVVHLEGDLVEVNGENGWHWRSSLTREDTGEGACELVYLRAIRVQ